MFDFSEALMIGAGVGLCKALLATDLKSRSYGKLAFWPKRASFLFLGVSFFFLLGWPGTLGKPLVLGSLQILSGVVFIFFSLLITDRAVFIEKNLELDQDPWRLPAELFPLGARWGWHEEVLAALLLAPTVAAIASGQERMEGVLILGAAWLGLVLPGEILSVFLKLLDLPGLARDPDAHGYSIAPGLHRFLGGLVSLSLVIVGALIVSQGLYHFL